MKVKINKTGTFMLILLALISHSLHAKNSKKEPKKNYPMAITMWDFSWLERRWPGAGYEDWDLALDELKERGYNCVLIIRNERSEIAD